jgi:Uncharacterised protein family (UPF0158)
LLLRRWRREEIYSGLVLDLSSLDLEEIADALADQTDYEHRWLINPETGEIAFWTADTGVDGQTPVDLDDLDLVCIDPLPSWVWYQDMADFAEGITDERAGRRLLRAIQGKGAFRRFKDELHEEYPDLLPAWYAFRPTYWVGLPLLATGAVRNKVSRAGQSKPSPAYGPVATTRSGSPPSR